MSYKIKQYFITLWKAIRNKPMLIILANEKVTARDALDVLYNSAIGCDVVVYVHSGVDSSLGGYEIPNHPHGRRIQVVGTKGMSFLNFNI